MLYAYSAFSAVNPIKLTLSKYPTITCYWTVTLILDHAYLVGNLTNSKNC